MQVIGSIQSTGPLTQLKLNPNPDDLGYTGFTSYEKIIGGVSIGQALYYDLAVNAWDIAQANMSTTIPCRAIALQTGNAEHIHILRKGIFKNTGWNFTSQNIYLSDVVPGGLTSDKPVNSNMFVQVIGTAISSDTAYFDFCPFAVQIA